MKKLSIVLSSLIVTAFSMIAQTIINPTFDTDIVAPDATSYNITGDVTLAANTEYILDRPVYVVDEGVLTIGEGAIIRGYPEVAPADPGTLVVTRDGKIFAEGTSTNPIIFTTAADPSGAPTDSAPFLDADPKNNPIALDKGLWGAVTILGNAPTNTGAIDTGTPGEAFIEGFAEDSRVIYGGRNVWDNSGVFKFVSIRYSGKTVVDGDEQQGITLGGVGAGTELEFVEVFGSDDDGIEIFGGTAEIRNFALIGHDDDGFDADQGWQGNAQFVLILNSYASYNSDHALEVDGDDTGDLAGDEDNISTDGRPFASGCLANFTVVGIPGSSQDTAARFRRGFGGAFVNSLFCGFSDAAGLRLDNDGGVLDGGANLPVLAGYGSIGVEDRVVDGSFVIAGNSFFDTSPSGVGAFELDVIANVYKSVGSDANTTSDPLFGQVGSGFFATDNGGCTPDDIAAGTFNPVPNPSVTSGWDNPVDAGNIFDEVTYRGAFRPIANFDLWTTGWTALNVSGIITSSN